MSKIRPIVFLVNDPTPPTPQIQEVQIGNQIWSAEDLKIDDGQGGITIDNGKYFYTAAAAVRIANSISGWHLPTLSEFEELVNTVGGNNATSLMLNGAWNITTTNSTEFNAIPFIEQDTGSAIDQYTLYNVVESSQDDGSDYYPYYGVIMYEHDYTYDTDSLAAWANDSGGWNFSEGALRLVKDSI